MAEHGDTMGTGEARELLARSYYHSAQLMRAVDSAREILERDPGNAYAVILLVRSLQRAGRTKEAAAAERMAGALGVLVPAKRAGRLVGMPPTGLGLPAPGGGRPAGVAHGIHRPGHIG